MKKLLWAFEIWALAEIFTGGGGQCFCFFSRGKDTSNLKELKEIAQYSLKRDFKNLREKAPNYLPQLPREAHILNLHKCNIQIPGIKYYFQMCVLFRFSYKSFAQA